MVNEYSYPALVGKEALKVVTLSTGKPKKRIFKIVRDDFVYNR